MAAATAELTSMPGVVAPVVAARIELILIAGVVVAELTIEDVLMVNYLLSGKTPSRVFKAFITSSPGGANITHGEMRERWNLAGSTSRLSSTFELGYCTSFNTAC
jgi:hypothetical protein